MSRDSALLNHAGNKKKGAAGTSETLRDEELWDPLHHFSQSYESLFCTSSFGFMLFPLLLMAAMMPSQ